jgi:urease accessory protein
MEGGCLPPEANRPMRIGVGGPVGTGKSSLIAALCAELAGRYQLGVVTNDIYTTEDAEFLRSTGVLDPDRIVAVQTGCCPHTAIRDDVSANLDAVERLAKEHSPLDLVFVESGGDNLTAVFGPDLADVQVFVLDCAGGDDVPRKGGPGVTRSDLLVINKTDLAPYVGADVQTMIDGARRHRGELPLITLSLRSDGAAAVAHWVEHRLADYRAGVLHASDVGAPLPHTHHDADHAHVH